MMFRTCLAMICSVLLSSCALGQHATIPQPNAPPNHTYASLFSFRDEMRNRLDKIENKQIAAPNVATPAVPPIPPGADQTALIYQLRLEIAQISYQIALLQQQQQQRQAIPPQAAPQPVQPIVLLYSPGGPPIALNPNPGPVIPLNPNPGPVIPLNPNPGPVIPLNPNSGPVVPLNPNPGPIIPLTPNPGPAVPLNPNQGTPILQNPVPVPGPGISPPNPGPGSSPIPLVPTPGMAPKASPPPPPTGYQTFTPFITATRRTEAVFAGLKK